MNIGELVFENDDIGRLAIHMGRAVTDRPAQYVFNNFGTGAIWDAVSGGCVLLGLNYINNNAGAAAVPVVFDGLSQTESPIILQLGVPASNGQIFWFGPDGIQMQRGISVFINNADGAAVFYRRHRVPA